MIVSAMGPSTMLALRMGLTTMLTFRTADGGPFSTRHICIFQNTVKTTAGIGF